MPRTPSRRPTCDSRADLDALREPRGWLTTVIGRICLDHLSSARVRREQYVGPWLPEPLVGSDAGLGMAPLTPEDRVTLDESVSMAMLVILESLSPPELHPAFPWTQRVNGATGLVFEGSDGIAGVMAFTVDGGRITEIDFVVSPEKLSRVPLPSRGDHVDILLVLARRMPFHFRHIGEQRAQIQHGNLSG